MDDALHIELFRRMWMVRKLETKVGELVTASRIPCSGHFGLGQEAVGVGVAYALGETDRIYGTHRGFAEYIGKGMTPKEILLEYYGKATSSSEGRLGQHLLDVERGIMPLPSSLGSEFGMSVGTALASKLIDDKRVTVNLFGEGTASQSDCAPSIEMASLWNLPILFVCNNNQYVELDSFSNVSPSTDVAPRASGYSMRYESADGNDVAAVYELARESAESARNGGGPIFLEFKTYRRGTHYTGDPGGYQPAEEIAMWEARDPIDLCRRELQNSGAMNEEEENSLLHDIDKEIGQAVEFAEDSPFPTELSLEAYAESTVEPKA